MQVLPSSDTNDSFDYLQIAEFTKECSAKWREMVSGQKKPFDDLAAKDKARYDKEVGLSLSLLDIFQTGLTSISHRNSPQICC